MTLVQRLSTAVVALALVGACGGASKPATPTADPLAGRYTATGGGGAINAVKALAARFSELHPGVLFQIDETGSDAGVNLATTGGVDFGFTSRALSADESKSLSFVNIGLAGTGVIVNSANPVKGLTKDQVRRIFAGEITNWKQVGGEDTEIKVFVREANAATRSSFESYFFGGKATYVSTATEVYEIAQTVKAVGSFRASVGMATASSQTAAETTIKLIDIDGVSPSAENVVSGEYKIGRPLLIVFPSDAAKVRPGLKAFIEWVKSPEGQRVAASAY